MVGTRFHFAVLTGLVALRFSTLHAGADSAAEAATNTAALVAILQSDATQQQKSDACRRLAQLGDASAVPVLAGLLTDVHLSHMARYALEPIPAPAVDAALRDALGKLRGRLLVGVIVSIGVRGDAQAVPAVIPYLQSTNGQVVAAAAETLATLATPPAVKALADFRNRAPEGPLRATAANASLVAAGRLLEQDKAAEAAAIYRELDTDAWPRHVALAAFAGLLKAEPQDAAQRITAAIAGDDAVRRAYAINQVATPRGASVRVSLLAGLDKLPVEARVLLIGALARANCGDALRPALKRALADASPEVRTAALEALARVGDASSVPVLCDALRAKRSEAESTAAGIALRGLAGAGIDAAIVSALKTAPVEARPALIDILADRGASGSVDALIEQAAQAPVKVRVAACRALSRLAGHARLPALIALLPRQGDDAGRGAAERMVAAVARKGGSPAERSSAVLQALKQATTAPERCSLLRVLGGIGDDAALPALIAATESAEPDVSDAAVRVLADWPHPTALDALVGLSRKTANRTHKVLLLRGCVRLLGLDARGADAKAIIYTRLLEGIETADEKRLILAGLGKAADAAALDVIVPMLDDPEVRPEAERAAVDAATCAQAAAPNAVKHIMARLATESKDEGVRKEAAGVVAAVDRLEGYTVAWQAAGPYTGSDAVVPPPLKRDASGVEWKPLSVDQGRNPPWMMDLAAALGAGNNRLCCVRTSVYSPAPRAVVLELGTDDGNQVWLNGKSVCEFPEGGAAVPGEHKVPVALEQGWNTLFMKITQISGPWQFCLRIVSTDGRPVEGLRYQPAREPPLEQRPIVEAPAALVPLPAPSDDGPAWTPLFNGEDLTGWDARGDAIFKVENGTLIGTQTNGKGGDLFTTNQWDDFELRVTYRMKWPGNSGFWFRFDGGKGYQYDVLKYTNPVAFSGTLYCPGKLFLTRNLDEAIENRDGWNDARLRADGDELTLWLNGRMTGRCRDATLRKGALGIQVHGGDGFKGMTIEIKRFDIRKPTAADKKQ